MKRHIIPCILSLTLLLTACGGEQAAADTAGSEGPLLPDSGRRR